MKYKTDKELPEISVVVIGLNPGQFVDDCLHAIKYSDYPQEKLQLIYVDSGSTDDTIRKVSQHHGVAIIHLNSKNPSAAKGRNAGARYARHDLIQFVDADTYLDPTWLRTAVSMMNGNVSALAGTLKERFPNKNFYHRMANMEWNLRQGANGWTTQDQEARVFGGNVLMKRDDFLRLGGYDENLPAGEDPDLSFRLRQSGKKILRLNAIMGSHDINMDNLKTFWKRTRRSGFAYASLALKHMGSSGRFMQDRAARILVSGLTPAFTIIAGLFMGLTLPAVTMALAMALRLLLKAPKFSRMFNVSLGQALQYSLYLSFVIYPQLIGLLDVFSTIALRVALRAPRVTNPTTAWSS